MRACGDEASVLLLEAAALRDDLARDAALALRVIDDLALQLRAMHKRAK